MKTSFSQYTPDEIRFGLESVRTMLITGSIGRQQFSMNFINATGVCGTIACLGGWLGHVFDMDHYAVNRAVCELEDNNAPDPHELRSLFYNFPAEPTHREKLLPFEGIEALNAWLAGNRTDPWASVKKRIDESECDPEVLNELTRLERSSLIAQVEVIDGEA